MLRGWRAAAVAVGAAAVLLAADAEIKIGDGGGSGTVLLSYGEEARTVTVLRRGESKVVSAGVVGDGGKGIWTVGEVGVGEGVAGAAGWTNYSVPFVFEEGLGVAGWTFEVVDADGAVERVDGEWAVAGLVVKADGQVVSGLGREAGVRGWAELAQNGTVEFEVEAAAAGGDGPVDLSQVHVSVRDENGQQYDQVSEAAVTAEGRLVLKFEPYRVGSGRLLVEIDAPQIEVDGEVFETVVNVRMGGDGDAAPPPVLVPDSVAVDAEGYASVEMYNLLSPPAEKDVEACVITVGGANVPHDVQRSKLVQPNQTVVFHVGSATGPASVSCDGVEVTILGGAGAKAFDVPEAGAAAAAAAGPGSASGAASGAAAGGGAAGGEDRVNGTLAANSLEPPLPEAKNRVRLGSQIRVVNGDPATYSVTEAADVLEAVCHFTDGSDCSLTRVTKGSAILDVEGYVDKGTEVEAAAKLRAAVDGCAFQKYLGMNDCGEMELLGEAAPLATSAVTAEKDDGKRKGGVSPLAIALTAAAGGIALILIVVAALWFVYRRNAEQCESDFSSSGPLGVPENDESLYQQAIVRDIYGRGDFAGGVPTVEAAEQSRREADLRETALRPPSSSGASSFLSPPTDDASSTYSV